MEIVLFLTKKKGPQKFSPNTNVKQPLPKPKEIITSLLPFPTKQSSSTLLSVSPVNIQEIKQPLSNDIKLEWKIDGTLHVLHSNQLLPAKRIYGFDMVNNIKYNMTALGWYVN